MNPNMLCVGCMENDSGEPLCPKCGRPFDLEPKNSLQLKPRTTLRDQYLIGRALGHGGFGITYLAWDVGLESRLAVKEYMPSGVAGRASGETKVLAYSEQTKQEFEWGLDRFLEEARVLKRFSGHPGIVSVGTIFRENGTAYLVMEYLDGMTFEEFLSRRGGKITFETALRVMLPVIEALTAVHAEGILHRDISPDNIHLTRTGKVKLIDFGGARNALGQKSRNLSIILKEGYAPEEQHRAIGIQGPWTDVYATAATLYHSITGQIPQPALDRQAEDKVRRPSEMGVEIEKPAEAALMKALAIKAIDRFQSMQDFASALTGSIDVSGATKVIDRNDPRVQALELAAQAPPPPPPPVAFIQHGPPPPPTTGVVALARLRWVWPAVLGAAALITIGVVLNRPAPDEKESKSGDIGVTSTTGNPGDASGSVTPGVSGGGIPSNRGRRDGSETPAVNVPIPTAGIPRADYESTVSEADQLGKGNAYHQAVQLYRKAIELDPAKPRAYSGLGQVQLYYLNDLPSAIESYHAALDRGGTVMFHVYHDHGGGNFTANCKGWLYISKSGVRFAAFDSAHKFQAQRGEIQEAKGTRILGNILGRPNGPTIDLHAFHIKLRSGQNYNFAPMSHYTDAQRDLILSVIGTG